MHVFKSERFISTLVVLLVMVLVSFVPQLAPMENMLVENGIYIIALLVGGYTITSTAEKFIDRNRAAIVAGMTQLLGQKVSIPYRGTVVTFDIPDEMEDDVAEAVVSAFQSALALAKRPKIDRSAGSDPSKSYISPNL